MKKVFIILAITLSAVKGYSQLPDFKTGTSFSYGYDQQTKELNLTWDFHNVGGATTNSFTIAYIASLDLNIGPEDYLIGSKDYASAVASAFATVTFTYGFGPNDLPSGVYNFIVYLDYGNNIQESNENNNIVSFGTFDYQSTTNSIHKFNGAGFKLVSFPNPANDEINVNFTNSQALTNTEYKLMATDGKPVVTGSIKNDINSQNKISVNHLSDGIYFLIIQSNGEIIESKKIVIKH